MSGPILLAGLCASGAVAWPGYSRRLRASLRLAAVAGPGQVSPHRTLSRGRRALVLALLVSPLAMFPAGTGLGLGLVLSLGARWLLLRQHPATTAVPPNGLAFAVDLLAAALGAGATLPDSLDAASRAVPEVAAPFSRAAAALRLGGDAAQA
ncbi:MAG: hypothetical protein QOJ92_2712, partial [Frankiales bacterium]|nr:hypothetical protein [Frankiales bacterium]